MQKKSVEGQYVDFHADFLAATLREPNVCFVLIFLDEVHSNLNQFTSKQVMMVRFQQLEDPP